jgi:putative endopeptidase
MITPRRTILAFAAFALVAPAFAGAQSAKPEKPRPPLVLADLDRSVSACTDFYSFAGGGWIASNPIPEAFSSWSPFAELRERTNLVLKDVLEHAARDARTTSDPYTKKLGTFYASCMDSAGAEAAGVKPLEAQLRRIQSVSSRADLMSAIAWFHATGMAPGFNFGSSQDAKNSTQVIVRASQGGLGLPNREYYTKSDPASERIKQAYVAYLGKLFTLLGDTPAAASANAARVMSLETKLANASRTPVQLRDPIANYNPMPITALGELTPAFAWQSFLTEVGSPPVATIDIGQPEYFRALDSALTRVAIEDWKAYLTARLANRAAPYLSSDFVNASHEFNATLTGARQQLPRWRRCLNTADQVLGDALGREYVKVAFTAEAKSKALEMIENLRAAMRERIVRAAWMSEATRERALTKLASFNRKIGYPDEWRDYTALVVENAPYATNYLHSRSFAVRRDLAKVGKPVDRNEWFMTPPTVNAYYAPRLNEIAFPAGRLQPPFFHPTYDEAANYGGIGGTIGHELSHGFDDSGRQYDSQGNLTDWWTADDARNYTAKAKMVEDQYSAYTVLDSLHVNGKLTLGENLADIVGVSVAYDALQKALAGKPRVTIDGFTPEQRFFLAYAQARRANLRPEQARLQIQTDPHSPGKFRVNGPLSNMPEFAKTFGCKPGDPMVRPENLRAHIW